MAKTRYVLVGTGIRAIGLLTPLVRSHRDQAELAALCDPSPARLGYVNGLLAGTLGYHAVPVYSPERFDQMLREQRADQVIVTSKDSTHHEYIVRALERGCDVITEKPMTIDAEKCRQILAAVDRTGRRVRVAFNYRWSAHRTKVKELVLSGVIGRITHVNVEYLLNTAHGADYFRRWHASMAESGGLLVHKATHHFDLVNWWIDAIPERVFAFGRLDFYGRANAIARGDEALTRYPRYTRTAAAEGDPFRLDLREDEGLSGLYLNAEADSGYLRDRNVFREDIDIYDNMSVLVRYRTGAQLTYSLLCFSPREGMRVSLNGDRGRIEYCEYQDTHLLPEVAERSAEDRGGDEIRVYPHFRPSYEVKVAKLEGGHDGSDPLLAEQLYAKPPPPDRFFRVAGPEQGAASILIGIAGNQSIAAGAPVNIADLVPLKPGASKLSDLT